MDMSEYTALESLGWSASDIWRYATDNHDYDYDYDGDKE